MKHVRTIKECTCTTVCRCSRNVYITCNEYASVWRFTATVCGWELPSALEWSYKKKEYKNYQGAKNAFLTDLAIKTW
jgi:hypothetical protein